MVARQTGGTRVDIGARPARRSRPALVVQRGRGDRRPLLAEPDGVLASRRPHGSTSVAASSRAAAGRDRRRLAAERTAVGERGRRLASRLAPRRVGLEVGGLDPRGRDRDPARRAGGERAEDRRRAWCADPAPCLRRARCLVLSPTTHSTRPPPSSLASIRRHGMATSRRRGRRRRRSRRRRAGHHDRPVARLRLRARPAAPPAGSWRGVARTGSATTRRERDRVDDRLPSGAAAEVCRQRAVDIDARGSTLLDEVRGSHDDARACRTRTAIRRTRRTRRRASRIRGSRPPTVVTSRPATRSAGVTQADAALRRRAPCNIRIDPAARIRPSPRRHRVARAAR